MIISQHDNQLLNPLQLRARASKRYGFIDAAASALVQKLGLEHQTTLSAREQLELQQCKWIDSQIQNYLTENPNAIGIELGAGINTRFHRLSARLEWPTFRWADINTPRDHAFSQSLLPITDNYRQIGCDIWNEDWLYRTSWVKGCPLLVVIEDLQPRSHDKLSYLLEDLRQRAQRFHLIVTWQGHLSAPIKKGGLQALSNAHFKVSKSPIVNRLSRLMGGPEWQGLHAISH